MRLTGIPVRHFVVCFTFSTCLGFTASAAADIVKSVPAPTVESVTGQETPDTGLVQQHQLPIIAVPEPAAFGIFSIALGIGGGLLVRNKRPDA